MSSKPEREGGVAALPSSIASDLQVQLNEDFARYGHYRIIVTVKHTGSHSLIKQHPGYLHWHCNPEALALVKATHGRAHVLTTCRDPLRVAASWYNRAELPAGTRDYRSPHNAAGVFLWRQNWDYYAEIRKLVDNVFYMDDLEHRLWTFPDEQNMHALLDAGDMDAFYKIADPELIEYAQNKNPG